ncbi:hypothetical protein IWW36_000609 [Coemansia brasiliensis]|uniref:BHLH domain-containing protein n=1 Tax=Coemansia brasiliensis TaxID=2650707 RepID=A0A9W8IAR7_9FUNG|nr:hypothetical protein IWW36_000609 [Coemansia brasiliensis]
MDSILNSSSSADNSTQAPAASNNQLSNPDDSSLYKGLGNIRSLGLDLQTSEPSLSQATSSGNLASQVYSTQFARNWMNSMLAQSTAPSLSTHINSNSSADESQAHCGIKRTVSTAMSSDSDSDNISKSLFFLSQQLASGQQPQQGLGNTGASPFPSSMAGTKDLNAIIGAQSSSGSYNPALTDMLEIGYDSGGRRVISMPNPLGNLSFEIPINPPVQPQAAMSAPFMQQGILPKIPSEYHTSTATSQSSMAAQHLSADTAASTAAFLGSSGSMESLLGIYTHPNTTTGISQIVNYSAADELQATDSSSPDQPMSQNLLSLHPASAKSKERPGKRQYARKRSAAQTAMPSPAGTTKDAAGLTASSASTPLLGNMTSSMISSLLPHRVDRQLAAAGARPLLFVRPSTKSSQSRRRKRRCVSSTDTASDDPLLSQPLDAESSNQWQRISEQRRRDAMRENFDLLKRMLPQEYMDSDDGRELARPVLLSRFLRWVDDTLIEMENLKAEVARLRLVAGDTGLPSSFSQISALSSNAPLPQQPLLPADSAASSQLL